MRYRVKNQREFKAHRVLRGLDQEHIATLLKLNQSNVSRVERRKSRLSRKNAEFLSGILGVGLYDLFDEERDRPIRNGYTFEESKCDTEN